MRTIVYQKPSIPYSKYEAYESTVLNGYIPKYSSKPTLLHSNSLEVISANTSKSKQLLFILKRKGEKRRALKKNRERKDE